MSQTVAAVGALVAALLELTIAPYLQVGGAQLDLVLVLATAWTVGVGIDGGIVWAFGGGLMLDILASRPLGATAFALLICIGIAAVLGRVLEPARFVGPALITLVVAFLYTGLLFVLEHAIRAPVPLTDPVGTIVPRVAFDAAVGALAGAAVGWWRRRYRERERLDW